MSTTISDRSLKLYHILNGKKSKLEKYRLLDIEPLLDSFLALYDLFCTPDSQKRDKHVANFVRKFGGCIDEIRGLRPNKDDFEIVKTIGRGHFGEVHMVREKNTKDIYAMKILKKVATLSNDNMAFYEEERDVMAFANSPWVTSLEYAFHDPENLYLVMEFLPGGDLLNLISRYEDSIMDEADAKFYLAEIITAVHVIHLLGYVHRDIKPENVLLDMTGHLKLADFGSAAKLTTNNRVVCKMPVGTPEYIAPEVLQSMNSGGGFYGCECDWWSVGIVFYEMLCGNVPFQAEGILKLYSQIMNHKKSLEFPDDVELSDSAKNLIIGLLEEQKLRFGYQELAKHDFFQSIDWTTLKSFKPPYIPQLKDSSDTSHFDSFTASKMFSSQPIVPNLTNTIPFLGFTFTKNLASALEAQTSRYSMCQRSTSIEEPDRKIVQISEQLNQNIEGLHQKLREQEIQMKKIEGESASLTMQVNQKNSQILILEEQLSNLTAERDKLKCNLEVLSSDNSSISGFRETISTLNSELSLERVKMAELINERDMLKMKLSNSSNEHEEIMTKLKNYEMLNEDLRNSMAENSAEYKKSLQELQSILNDSNVQFQEKLKISNEEAKNFRELAKNLEKQIGLYKENIVKNEEKESGELVELRNDIMSHKREIEALNTTINTLQESLTAKDERLKNDEIVILRLNQNIRVLENQCQQRELRDVEFEKQLSASREVVKQLRSENQNLTSSNQALKNSHEVVEKKVAELLKSLERVESSFIEERKTATDKFAHYQKLIDDNMATITKKNSDILQLQNLQCELQAEKSNMNEQVQKGNAEIERLNAMILAQKNSNFSLMQEQENLQIKIGELSAINEDLSNKISSIESNANVQIFKLESTINQQSKLINFLQTDVEKRMNVKGKQKPAPLPRLNTTAYQGPPARKDRDLEKQLEIERNNCLKLNSEVTKLKEKINSLKLKKGTVSPFSTITSSHRNSEASLLVSLDEHNSPVHKEHVMNNLYCYHPNTCFICLRPISYAQDIIQCTICGIFFHATCQPELPSFPCTILSGFTHVESLFDGRDFYKKFIEIDAFRPKIPYLGYLSIPNIIGHNKYDWRKHLIEVTTTHLYIKNETNGTVEETGFINYKAMKEPCIVRPAIHTSDILFTPPVNVPLVFGIEINCSETSNYTFQSDPVGNENNSPSTMHNTILFLLAQSLEEKRMWVRMLEDVFAVPAPEQKSQKYEIEKIDTFSCPNISSICSAFDDIIMIGHSMGLAEYDLHEHRITFSSEQKIEVHTLYQVGSYIFALIDKNRQLARVDRGRRHKSLMNIMSKKKQNTVLEPIESFDNCFDIHYGEIKGDWINLYVSKPLELYYIRIPFEGHSISSLRVDIGDIPISSMTVVDNCAVVCQDKFYVYNMEKNIKKEFLDPDDHSLAFIVFGSSSNSNYPMNVFQTHRTETPEFLICCSEFGIIVDKEGRRLSDGPLRWDQIPLSFHYNNRYLCICYPDKVEIRDIAGASLAEFSTSIRPYYMNFKCPTILTQHYLQEDYLLVSQVNLDYSLSIHRIPLKKVVARRTQSIISTDSHDSSISKSAPCNTTALSTLSSRKSSLFKRNKK